jgi:hypothetical protein
MPLGGGTVTGEVGAVLIPAGTELVEIAASHGCLGLCA